MVVRFISYLILVLGVVHRCSSQSDFLRPANAMSTVAVSHRPNSVVTVPNIRVSSPSIQGTEEVTIAINSVNPLNLAAAANIPNSYISTDGGLHWISGLISSTLGVMGDPSLVYDAQGNLYYGHLSNAPRPGYFLDRIVVQKSTDGGSTWDNGSAIGYNPPRRNQDKEWLASDMTNSPFRNRIYLAWTQFDFYASTSALDSSRVLFSFSTDAGVAWSLPVRVSDQAGNCLDGDSTVMGAVPAVGLRGEVYTAWAGPRGIMFDKSTDGGETFGTDVFVTTQPGGWDFRVPGISRCNGLPVTACDVSNSRYQGTIYVGWSDQRFGPDNTDVFIAKSTDGGATWTGPRQVNDDATATHQFLCWMTIDQTTGNIYFVFYDRRNSNNLATDVYVARSTDGGDTFVNSRVSQSAFTPPVSGAFLGDYTGIAANNGKVYPIWTRVDDTGLSEWLAIINDPTMDVLPPQVGEVSSFVLGQSYPNPCNPSATIRYGLPRLSYVTLAVYNLLGQEVSRLVEEQQHAGYHDVVFRGDGLASGVYYYRFEAGGFVAGRKLLLLK